MIILNKTNEDLTTKLKGFKCGSLNTDLTSISSNLNYYRLVLSVSSDDFIIIEYSPVIFNMLYSKTNDNFIIISNEYEQLDLIDDGRCIKALNINDLSLNEKLGDILKHHTSDSNYIWSTDLEGNSPTLREDYVALITFDTESRDFELSIDENCNVHSLEEIESELNEWYCHNYSSIEWDSNGRFIGNKCTDNLSNRIDLTYGNSVWELIIKLNFMINLKRLGSEFRED